MIKETKFGIVATLLSSKSVHDLVRQAGKKAPKCDVLKLAALVPNHRLYNDKGVFVGTSTQFVEGAPKRNQLWNSVCEKYRAKPAFLILLLKRIFDLDVLLTDGVYEVLIPESIPSK